MPSTPACKTTRKTSAISLETETKWEAGVANYNALLSPGANPGGSLIEGLQAAQQQGMSAQRMNMLANQDQRAQQEQQLTQNRLTQQGQVQTAEREKQLRIEQLKQEYTKAQLMEYSPTPKLDLERAWPAKANELKQGGMWDSLTDDQIRQGARAERMAAQSELGIAPDPQFTAKEGPRGSVIQTDPRTGEQKQIVGPDNTQTQTGLTAYQQGQLDLQNRKLDATLTGNGGKPIPVGALRLVDDAKQAIGTAGASTKLVDDALTKLQSGKVKLGLVNNATARARNAMGSSSEASLTYADIKQTFEKLRNNYLLLAKGVQTEGDATRAWNSEIGESAQNDNALAIQQLNKAKGLISGMVDMQNSRIDTVYSNYGSGRPDAGMQPAQGQPTSGNLPPANAKGWKLHQDAQGNKAYVSPDGKQFEVAQ
jgi:hypothetical protein